LKHRGECEADRAFEVHLRPPGLEARCVAISLGAGQRATEHTLTCLVDELVRARRRSVGAAHERVHRRGVDRGGLSVEIRDRLVTRGAHVGGLLRLHRILEAGDRDVGREVGKRGMKCREQIVERVQVFDVAQTAQRRRPNGRGEIVRLHAGQR
jgi:hypothetical protein